MSVSKYVEDAIVKSSWVKKMSEEGAARKARFGQESIFDFSLGNPDLGAAFRAQGGIETLADDPPPRLGQHGHVPNAGFVKTRESVAAFLSGHIQSIFTPEDIVMTTGEGSALNVVFKTTLKGGRRCSSPDPALQNRIFISATIRLSQESCRQTRIFPSI